MSDDLPGRVKKMEYALWGLTGDNGLLSQVRELRKALQQGLVNETRRREELEDEAEEKTAAARRERRRIRWTALGITVAGAGSLLTVIVMLTQGSP